MTPDLVTIGRHALVEGSTYEVIEVKERELTLERVRRGEMDPPSPRPPLLIGEAAPLYVRVPEGILACVVSQIEELGRAQYLKVKFAATGWVKEEGT